MPLGLLLQELWREWNISDKNGWINIENLDFDVREQDVAKLLASESALKSEHSCLSGP